MEDLKNSGLDLDSRSDDMLTPLISAAICDELDPLVVDFLIESGVSLDAKDSINNDSYLWAIDQLNYPFIVRILPYLAPEFALNNRVPKKFRDKNTNINTKDLAMHVLKRAWTKLIEEGDSARVKLALKQLEPYIAEKNRIGEYARFCHDNLK
jgi:ankyrin repeat protein